MSNDQHQQDQPKETTKQTMPGSPVQPGQEYETPEPKRRETGPQAETKRAPQHEPGYEAKHQKEAQKRDPNKDREGSQADHATARNQARDDLQAEENQKGKRAHTARRKTDTKRSKPPRRHK